MRLKRYMEMRGADVGPRGHILAFTALCAGLFYDAQRQRRRVGSGRGLFPPRTARPCAPRSRAKDWRRRSAAAACWISRATFCRWRGRVWRAAVARRGGRDETHFLEVLEEIAATGETLAQKRLALYHGAWSGSVLPAFETCVY